MNDRLENFYDFIRGKRIAMLGIGRSNAPLVRMFREKGAQVTACDRRDRAAVGSLADELESAGAALRLGPDYLRSLDFDIIFRTPGMKFTLPELDEARRHGVAVTSEMEVFFDVCPCRKIAVTGSDGKTTTTTLISEMLKQEGCRVHLGGNIGRPLLPEIEHMRADDVAVVELSSFQLISMRSSPEVAVITNISPNHLDMHKNMAEYVNAKRNIIAHQDAFSRAVLNLDNDITASMIGEIRGAPYLFSRKQPVALGCFADGDGVVRVRDGTEHVVIHADDIRIPGSHNLENYLAAISAVWGMVSPENIRSVARSFAGVEHRIEFVRELDGVRYYNDSIATTPTRTIAGLHSFPRKVILIAGGYDKHIPFDGLGPHAVEKVKCLILLGDTADKIERAVTSAPGYNAREMPIVHVSSLEQAVQEARRRAGAGDIVTLSPACASFDMFRDFETRGNLFKNLVMALETAPRNAVSAKA